MENAAELIKDLGFPIFMAIVLLYLIYEENKNHKEETAELTKAINALTVMVEKVNQHISDITGKGDASLPFGNDEEDDA